ncbi:ABC transporter permease [Galactobacter valiniphilus]|uniref:Cell division protein FtsX n=1 Tax=Galactobacter valiniphilus TaxID=2676122 RepID=A0A399JFV5_9MICC|nr:permease-like cell division protein FtsX [Galactobacter valiniphilus]RII43022.1 ABC transporter permease [Galactobacter valiniphilus]
MKLSFMLSEIASGLRRNLSMVVSVILVTFVSLTFVGSAALLQSQVGKMKGYWYDKVQVAIYLCSPNPETANCAVGGDGKYAAATAEQTKGIEEVLNSAELKPYVESFQYESQEDAYKNFQEQFGNRSMADSVKPEQLPASFRVKLVDPEKYDVINERFSSLPGVDTVVDQRQYLNTVFGIINTASLVAVIIAAVMLVCAVLLVATTIRLSAFTRRRETGIMRLVGASKAVIQTPFVLEGVIASAIGAILASGVLWAVLQFVVQDRLAQQNLNMAFIDPSEMLWVAPGLLIVGVLLAWGSSLLTLRRYLKV